MSNSVLINFARFYATTKHAGQLYAGAVPYTHHLAAVEEQVKKWWDEAAAGIIPVVHYDEIVAAAWLHDVMEDCGVKRKELHELFTPFVAELVWRVTNEPGENRRVRHALTYPKIREAPAAVFLKLCDRIANVEMGGALVEMYQKEHEDFWRALHTQGQLSNMWLHLDALFTMQEPRFV